MDLRLRAIAARAGGPCLAALALLAPACGGGIPADATRALPPSKFRPAPKDDAKLPAARTLVLAAGDLKGAAELAGQSGEPTIDQLAEGDTPETRDTIAANWQDGYRSAFGAGGVTVVSEVDLFRTSAQRIVDAWKTIHVDGVRIQGQPSAVVPGGYLFETTGALHGKRLVYTGFLWRRGPGVAVLMVSSPQRQLALATRLAKREDALLETALAGL